MTNLEERNQKIIDAVVKKANIVCPGALALIGIYGSFMTGDFHEKSDLDLLILINDDRHLALMSLVSAGAMFSEIGSEVNIGRDNVLEGYDSQNLHRTAQAYDDILSTYLKEYEKAKISVRQYSDIDAFVSDY